MSLERLLPLANSVVLPINTEVVLAYMSKMLKIHMYLNNKKKKRERESREKKV